MIPLSGYAKVKKYIEFHAELTDHEILQLKKKYPGPTVTISRQSGIETNLLCEKLIESFSSYYSTDWVSFDKDLIRKVISDHNLPPQVQKFLSEEKVSTISQMLNELMGIHPPILKLVHKMVSTILNLAEIGNVILVGRGSNVITSHLKNTYHIRLVAPLDQRIKHLQKSRDIKKEWAKKILLRGDENRKDFLLRTFRKDIDDPLLYHSTINVSLFSFDELVNSIVEAVWSKHPIIKSPITERVKLLKEIKINKRDYYETA